VTKTEDIFIQILIVCGEENQHLSAIERAKKNATQTSDASLEQQSIVSRSFYGKRFRSRRDVRVDILPFFNTKSIFKGKRYFCILSLGELYNSPK